MDAKQTATEIYRRVLREIRGDRVVQLGVSVTGNELVVQGTRFELGGRRVRIAGAGKASIAMAEGLEALLGGRVADGLVIGKEGEESRLVAATARFASHPVPSEASLQAGEAMIAFADSCGGGDLVLFCLSGGASALMEALEPGWTLARLQEETRDRLNGGVPIEEINAFRVTASAIKGGKLRRRFGKAEVIVLVMSDVGGNDLGVIGSGPLHDGETRHFILADRATLAQAALRVAGEFGLAAALHPVPLQGEAREAAASLASLARGLQPGQALIAVGETVVTVRGSGSGGRAQEFAMAGAPILQGQTGMALLCGSTDGTDGPTEHAGGVVDAGSLDRAGIDLWEECMDANDSSRFLAACDGLLQTGPTGSNLTDVAILVWG